MGSDGRTPTERLRGRGVQRPVYELGEKVFLFLPLAPARQGDFWRRVRLWDLPRLQIIRWPGVHWNTLRSDQVQDSATAQWSGEMGHRIRVEHQRNPVVSRRESVPEMSTSVWICPRLEVTGVHIRQTLTHQSPPGECASLGRFERFGLTANAWVAVPFEREFGTRQTTLSKKKGRQMDASVWIGSSDVDARRIVDGVRSQLWMATVWHDGTQQPRAVWLCRQGKGGRVPVLVVVAAEVEGRWSQETADILNAMAKAKAEEYLRILQGRRAACVSVFVGQVVGSVYVGATGQSLGRRAILGACQIWVGRTFGLSLSRCV